MNKLTVYALVEMVNDPDGYPCISSIEAVATTREPLVREVRKRGGTVVSNSKERNRASSCYGIWYEIEENVPWRI